MTICNFGDVRLSNAILTGNLCKCVGVLGFVTFLGYFLVLSPTLSELKAGLSMVESFLCYCLDVGPRYELSLC